MLNHERWGIEASPTTTEESLKNKMLADGGQPSVLDEIDLEAAFEDVPRIEAGGATLDAARRRFPKAVVPEGEPADGVPDPHHDFRPEVTIEVPDWVVATVAWQLSQQHKPDERALRDIVFECVQVAPTFVTTDGEALDELLLDGGDR
ncbi:MAG: hypothetical protein ACOCY1_04445 [Halovenus sp.]